MSSTITKLSKRFWSCTSWGWQPGPQVHTCLTKKDLSRKQVNWWSWMKKKERKGWNPFLIGAWQTHVHDHAQEKTNNISLLCTVFLQTLFFFCLPLPIWPSDRTAFHQLWLFKSEGISFFTLSLKQCSCCRWWRTWSCWREGRDRAWTAAEACLHVSAWSAWLTWERQQNHLKSHDGSQQKVQGWEFAVIISLYSETRFVRTRLSTYTRLLRSLRRSRTSPIGLFCPFFVLDKRTFTLFRTYLFSFPLWVRNNRVSL